MSNPNELGILGLAAILCLVACYFLGFLLIILLAGDFLFDYTVSVHQGLLPAFGLTIALLIFTFRDGKGG